MVGARRVERPVALAVAVGLLGDQLLGEPPDRWHPVAAFGRAMSALEARSYADRFAPGVVYATAGVGSAALIGRLAAGRPGSRSGRAAVAAGAGIYVTVAARELRRAAARVGAALDAGDLDGARSALPGLVGRDPTGLPEAEIVRAVVESVAENTVDAVVAPALWGLLGAPGALGYRAVNTLDAMVGHRSARYARFGWASARADDAANWVPARVTALLVALVRPAAARAVWRAVRDQAPEHPSPNAGVVEAAFAAALGLRLGGTNVYGGRIERRAPLGSGRPPVRGDIGRARRLSRDVTAALATGVAAAALSRAPARDGGLALIRRSLR